VTDIDLLAIGCGPFNLGLAALASTVADLRIEVLDREQDLSWHPGMMLDEASLQVSFLADLVSLIDPTHPLSFLAYLADTDRMYPFYVRERFHPTRREYEDYLRWAAGRLPCVHFGHDVREARFVDDRFVVSAEYRGRRVVRRAENLVIGVGTEPWIADALTGLPRRRLAHTADYLPRRVGVLARDRVTVVGSGQSGAEVVLDLLRARRPSVSWLTRTESFAPLDYTKLVLEMTTPDYVRYFHTLPEPTRYELIARQWRHYKGVSTETLEAIHDQLYDRRLRGGPATELRSGVSVLGSSTRDGRVELRCAHQDTGREFTHTTDVVIAATGYRRSIPPFLEPLREMIRTDGHGNLAVRLDHSVELDPSVTGRIFVANADLHSHGVAAPDLGIGAWRNATIINTVAGREIYRLPRHTAFTTFGADAEPN
jgi:lysine N6-hydroxylase